MNIGAEFALGTGLRSGWTDSSFSCSSVYSQT